MKKRFGKRGQEDILMTLVSLAMAFLVGTTIIALVNTSLDPTGFQKKFFRKDIGMTLATLPHAAGQLNYNYKADYSKMQLDIDIAEQGVSVYNRSNKEPEEQYYQFYTSTDVLIYPGMDVASKFSPITVHGNRMVLFDTFPAEIDLDKTCHLVTRENYEERKLYADGTSEEFKTNIKNLNGGKTASEASGATITILAENVDGLSQKRLRVHPDVKSRRLACFIANQIDVIILIDDSVPSPGVALDIATDDTSVKEMARLVNDGLKQYYGVVA